MSGEVLEAYKYSISQPGAVTAVINYYRCMLNQNRRSSGTSEMIKMPILLILGIGIPIGMVKVYL